MTPTDLVTVNELHDTTVPTPLTDDQWNKCVTTSQKRIAATNARIKRSQEILDWSTPAVTVCIKSHATERLSVMTGYNELHKKALYENLIYDAYTQAIEEDIQRTNDKALAKVILSEYAVWLSNVLESEEEAHKWDIYIDDSLPQHIGHRRSMGYDDKCDGFNRSEMSRSKRHHSQNTKQGKLKRTRSMYKTWTIHEEDMDIAL